ncbi:MAG: glycosyltransferase [Flavobacteriales bacterium]|nr:glycosyltransferase [Flavobacteriales bacterium]
MFNAMLESQLVVEVIYNGVLRLADHAELNSHSEERWRAPSPFTFLLAGLIHPSKGQEEAIRALALVKEQCPDVRLVIAGGGKTEHLKRLIAETGMQTHVDLPGFVPDMRPLLLSSHALLMCSRNEAMGRVTVEGMGSGLPVIGHNSGGTPELIGGEHGGLLYDHGPEELAQLMIGLANDPAKAREMGQHLMRSAADRFNVERYTTEVLGVYRSVLSRFAK